MIQFSSAMALSMFNVRSKMASFKTQLTSLAENKMETIYEDIELCGKKDILDDGEKYIDLEGMLNEIYEVSEGIGEIPHTPLTSLSDMSDDVLMSSGTDEILSSITDEMLREWGVSIGELGSNYDDWSIPTLEYSVSE